MSDLAYFLFNVFLPLFVGHVIVPPLNGGLTEKDVLINNKYLEDIVVLLQDLFTPPEFRSSSYVRENLCYPIQKGGVSYKNITYMFVHESWNHMFRNLWGIFTTGNYLYKQTKNSTNTVMTVYFVSGVVAIIPLKYDIKNWTKVDSSLFTKVVEQIKNISNINFINTQITGCGSSAGVFGLLGASSIFALSSIIRNTRKWIRTVQNHCRGKSPKTTFEIACLVAASTVRIYSFSGVGLVLGSITFCLDIIKKHYDKANGVIILDRTNHDAHFKGFLVGVGFGFWYISKSNRKVF